MKRRGKGNWGGGSGSAVPPAKGAADKVGQALPSATLKINLTSGQTWFNEAQDPVILCTFPPPHLPARAKYLLTQIGEDGPFAPRRGTATRGQLPHARGSLAEQIQVSPISHGGGADGGTVRAGGELHVPGEQLRGQATASQGR